MLTLAALRAKGDALLEEIARESYAARAGLKTGIDLQSIYERYSDIAGPESLALSLQSFKLAQSERDRWRAGLLLNWQIDLQSSRSLAALDEAEMLWESTANVEVSAGQTIPFRRINAAIAGESDREQRLVMEAGRAAAMEQGLAPLRLERLKRELAFLAEMQLGDSYTSIFESLSGISIGALAEQCTEFLRATQELWDALRTSVIRRVLRIDPSDANRADVAMLIQGHEFDRHFTKDTDVCLRRFARGFGLDPTANGHIVFDTAARDGKLPRASCASVRVPQELYLVIQPQGGQSDVHEALHEFGHALHFGHTSEELDFEFRRLGDNSVSEAYAMLLDHLTYDPTWLATFTTLRGTELKTFVRAQGFSELFSVRRYAAKLLFESQLYASDADWGSLPDLYVKLLDSATGFRHHRSAAFVDLDRQYYVVRYLRAWQLQALLRGELTTRYGPFWWNNPEAGPWMRDSMWRLGQSESADALSSRICRQGLSFDELVRSIETMIE